MIIKEFYREREDGVKLYRTCSDGGMKIRQIETGNLYSEAIDVESAAYTYEEIDIPIEDPVESGSEASHGLMEEAELVEADNEDETTDSVAVTE